MRAVTCIALFLALAGVALSKPSHHTAPTVPDGQVSWSDIRSLLMRGVDDRTPHTFFKGLMQNIVAALPAEAKSRGPAADRAGPYNAPDGTPFGPWFGWIPLYEASSVPGANGDATADFPTLSNSWSAPCFANNTLTSVLTLNSQGVATGAQLTLTSTHPTSLLCSDWYLIGTLDGLVFKQMEALKPGPAPITYTFRADISQSEMTDIQTNGFRVFRFLNDLPTTLADLYDTVMLFLPAMMTTGPVPDNCAKDNLAFLQSYVDIAMEARNTTVVNIDEGLVQSGDLFGIIRLDGLDPMLAWAMGGSHTGHTTIGMRSDDGTLHICESTTKDNYWPTNGIQCTPYQQWIQQAINADYNVVWLPLSGESRAAFNNTRAWEMIEGDLGLNYGFSNMLWAWVDFESDNYPYPLTWQAHSMLPAWLGHLSGSISNLMWNDAWNQRLGTAGLDTPDLYAKAASMGLTFGAMVSIPEQDEWMYAQPDNNGTTVKGHSSVCDVLVCRVWKAAGIFGDTDFQCTEATNWDIYTLNIFEPNQVLPPQCTEADPSLPFCQLVGKFRLTVPFYNTRQLVTNSFNSCPRGNPPDWNKPAGC